MDDNNNNIELAQVTLRQVLGVHKAIDINVRNTLLNICDGINVGLMFEGINKNKNKSVENIEILKKCIPHIFRLRQVIAEEMNLIIQDNSLDSLTALAATILDSIMAEDAERKDLQ